jgi:hypothetical protein
MSLRIDRDRKRLSQTELILALSAIAILLAIKLPYDQWWRGIRHDYPIVGLAINYVQFSAVPRGLLGSIIYLSHVKLIYAPIIVQGASTAALIILSFFMLLLLALAMWPVTLLTLWLPGRYYFHYQLYAIFCLPLSVIVAQYALPDLPATTLSATRKAVVSALVVLAVAPFSMGWWRTLRLAREDAAYESSAPAGKPRAFLDWMSPASNATVFQWGWEPGLMAYSGMRSADRAAVAEYLMRPNSVRDYLRARLLRDFHRNSPTIVMDTVRDGYSVSNLGADVDVYHVFDSHLPDADPERMNLRTFPELYTFVSQNYQQIAGDDNRCAALYVRGDMASKIQSAEIPLQSSAPALTSSWGTERCHDWWEPSPNDARADIRVDPAQPVGELWILTSRGGLAQDRGTTQVRITYLAVSGQSKDQVIGLYDYPDWTVVTPPVTEPLSKISIQSVSFVGHGPALAAVKAFRAGWALQPNRDQ